MAANEITAILTNYKQGSKKHYDILLQHLSNKDELKDDLLLKLLSSLKDCTALLGRDFEHLVGSILKIDWLYRDLQVVREYQRFVINLVSAHTDYLKACLRMVVQQFVPNPRIANTHGTPLVDQSRQKQEERFLQLHCLLKHIVKMVPMTPVMLIPLLTEYFPYMQRDAYTHSCYVNNLLNLLSYMPDQRSPVLELIVDRMTKLDVRSPRHAIEETDCDNEDDMFEMDELKTEGQKMIHQEADRLDVMMEVLLKYMEKVCKGDKEKGIDWDATKNLYRDLLRVFDRIILPTHASCHIQFLMFFICQYHNGLVTGFLDYLWKKVCNPNTQSIFRQAAVAYIASMLARAKYIPLETVKNCINLLVSWIHCYIQQTADSDSKADVIHHGPFYSVCQSVFYIFAFRHKELLGMPDGYKYCQDLHLQTIVTCRLNPLRVCLPIVARTFSSITRKYQLAYCDSIMEHNRRMILPETGFNTSSSQCSSSCLTNMNPLDSFFPFDPYLLRRSGRFIHDIYQEYEGFEEDEEERNSVRDDDDCFSDDSSSYDSQQDVDFGSYSEEAIKMATSPTDLLKYSISPGFKHM